MNEIYFNDGQTKPSEKLITTVIAYFRNKEYVAGINEPFPNSRKFATSCGYKIIMIEVNKKLYMNEETFESKPHIIIINEELTEFYKMINK